MTCGLTRRHEEGSAQAVEEVGDQGGCEVLGERFVGDQQAVVAGPPQLVDHDLGVDIFTDLAAGFCPVDRRDREIAAGP